MIKKFSKFISILSLLAVLLSSSLTNSAKAVATSSSALYAGTFDGQTVPASTQSSSTLGQKASIDYKNLKHNDHCNAQPGSCLSPLYA